MIGFLPLFILATTELSWKPFEAVIREDIYIGILWGLLGMGIALLRRHPKIGMAILLVGFILYLSAMREGLMFYIQAILSGNFPIRESGG